MLIHNGTPIVGPVVVIRNPSYRTQHVLKLQCVEPSDAMIKHFRGELPTDTLLLPCTPQVSRSLADVLCGGDQGAPTLLL